MPSRLTYVCRWLIHKTPQKIFSSCIPIYPQKEVELDTSEEKGQRKISGCQPSQRFCIGGDEVAYSQQKEHWDHGEVACVISNHNQLFISGTNFLLSSSPYPSNHLKPPLCLCQTLSLSYTLSRSETTTNPKMLLLVGHPPYGNTGYRFPHTNLIFRPFRTDRSPMFLCSYLWNRISCLLFLVQNHPSHSFTQSKGVMPLSLPPRATRYL